jgi:methyltransferase (TIGR00027 family)
MPSHLKDLVRARMEKTGESYQRALEHVRAQETRAPTPAQAPDGQADRPLTFEDTAFSIATVRAEEAQKPAGARLFEDPFAAAFSRAGGHAAEATERLLNLPFFRDGIRLRTRFIDDFVIESIAAGLDQVVILGAGFDMRALRLRAVAERDARVYEVDTAPQLERKRTILKEARVKIPPRVAYVPFDFTATDFDALGEALEQKGFRRDAGAVFVWEGVIGYIDTRAADRTLHFMAQAGGPRGRVVVTHVDSSLDSSLNPDVMTATKRAGFARCREFASDELWRRFLPGEPHPNAWAVKISTAFVAQ